MLISTEPKFTRQHPQVQSVQVTATPSKNRHNNLYPGLPKLKRSNTAGDAQVDVVPPSSISKITDSVSKEPHLTGVSNATLHKEAQPSLTVLEQTPSRGSLKLKSHIVDQAHSTRLVPNSLQTQCSATPSKPTKFIRHLSVPDIVPPRSTSVTETPPKHHNTLPVDLHLNDENGDITSEIPHKDEPPEFCNADSIDATAAPFSSQDYDANIYTSLGWDDVDDLA